MVFGAEEDEAVSGTLAFEGAEGDGRFCGRRGQEGVVEGELAQGAAGIEEEGEAVLGPSSEATWAEGHNFRIHLLPLHEEAGAQRAGRREAMTAPLVRWGHGDPERMPEA